MTNVILMIQLSTRDVEKIVALVFEVPCTDMLALRARLENLRKKDCPSGLVTGRGKVAKFDFKQLAILSFALALIDAGLSPDYAVFAIEDDESVVRECFALLTLQKPSVSNLIAAFEAREWPEERAIIAWCNMHRLLSNPRDEGFQVPAWVAYDLTGGSRPVDLGLSAVRIDFGTLFVRLVIATAKVSGVNQLTIAQGLLAQMNEYVVHP